VRRAHPHTVEFAFAGEGGGARRLPLCRPPSFPLCLAPLPSQFVASPTAQESGEESEESEAESSEDELHNPAVAAKQLQRASPFALYVMAAAVKYDARPSRSAEDTSDDR
jgi:hypothetical protein